jgi:hypothetical protein
MIPAWRGWILAAALWVTASAALAAGTNVAVVRQARGDVRLMDPQDSTTAVEVKAGDLPDSGRTFVTGPDGFLSLRFHPDFMSVQVSPRSRVAVNFAAEESGASREVVLGAGRVTVGVTRQGPGLTLEDAHSRAVAREGRLSFATGPSGSVVLVLEGQAEVTNRATGAAVTVKRGEKAVSGPEGVKVARASAREAAEAGLGQNLLEVDFWNPATEDFSTLEVEYEARP